MYGDWNGKYVSYGRYVILCSVLKRIEQEVLP